MELSKLKKYRTYVPGLIIIIFLVPFFINFINFITEHLTKDWLKFFAVTGLGLISLILGTLYNKLDLRNIWNSKSHKRIVTNIKIRIINEGISEGIEVSSGKKSELLSNEKLMHIFYNIVDHDKSLTEKSKLVKYNGLKWTTASDIGLISFVFTFIYLAVFFFSWNKLFLIFSIISMLITILVGVIFHDVVVRDHVDLSNAQLDYIFQIKKDTLLKLLNKIV